MLNDFANRPGHTAILIGSPSTPQEELAQVHDAIRSRPGLAVLEASFALTARPDGADGHGRVEPAVADRLGVGAITLLVVRPDGHVGLRADANHADALETYGALLGV
ncbi:hypothetical protein [Xanthobacter versatilis]